MSSRSTAPVRGIVRFRGGLLVLAAVLAVTGCGQAGSDGGPETGGTATEGPGTSSGGSTSPPGGISRPQPTELTVTPPPAGTDVPGGTRPGPGSAAEAAVHDLANRLGVAPDDVTVVGVNEVTWNDASLGCPKPGMFYAQVVTPGSRIVLQAGGRSYEYHAADGRAPILCEGPQLPSSTSS